MKDTWTIIDDRISAMSELNTRQDSTANLLYWQDTPYKLLKPDGKTKIRDAINVTPNNPAVFVSAIIADLMGAKWQPIIEGELSGRQEHALEGFLDDSWAMADEDLLRRFGWSSLRDWLCNHVCARWAIGTRWLSGIDKEGYKVDCLPVDMRWTPFEFGSTAWNGLSWVAPITFRTKADIEAEYPDIKVSGKTDIEVRDYWDSDKNEVWIAQKLAKTEKNTFGYPPFVIVIPPTGFMLRDKGYLKHEGEDSLFLNKGVYEEWARTLSLEATHGYAGLYPSYEREVEVIDDSETPPLPQLDETIDVKKGERHVPVPRGDINRAGLTIRQDIVQMLTEGGYVPPREYNTPPSALLIATEVEIKGKLLNPRLKALEVFGEQLSRMMIDQFLKSAKGKGGLLVGKRGRRHNYTISQMGDPDKYTISYQVMSRNKRQEIANLAQFAAVYGKLPLRWNLTNILIAEDPDGIIRELEIEQAKQADPAIGLHEMALRCVEEADELEDEDEANAKLIQAKMLMERGVALIKARMVPAPVSQAAREPKVEAPKGAGNLLPGLLGQGGGGGGGRQAQQPEEIIPE